MLIIMNEEHLHNVLLDIQDAQPQVDEQLRDHPDFPDGIDILGMFEEELKRLHQGPAEYELYADIFCGQIRPWSFNVMHYVNHNGKRHFIGQSVLAWRNGAVDDGVFSVDIEAPRKKGPYWAQT